MAHHGGYPANTTAVADFTAVARGTVHLVSETDLACVHAKCAYAPPQRQFMLTIVLVTMLMCPHFLVGWQREETALAQQARG
jgi:hypothetical protein